MRSWTKAALWLHKPEALRLTLPPLSEELAGYRRRVLLSVTGGGVMLAAALGLAINNGWVWGWLGLVLVLAAMIWGVSSNEARVRVLPYLQLLEAAYGLENRVYVADSKPGQPRLSIGNVQGEAHDYQVYEVNAGGGLEWNTEVGRQNLAATILADVLEPRLLAGEDGQALIEALIKAFSSELAVFLFRRKEKGQVYLRDNFSTTRHKVINFVAGRL